MYRLYALAVAVAMQVGLLVSRATMGSSLSDSGISFGESLLNNAIASVLWAAPLVLPIAVVNYFSFLLLFRSLVRSPRLSARQSGAAAATLSAILVIILGRAGEWISLALANVTNYSDPGSLEAAAWISSSFILAWSALVGTLLIPLATRAKPARSGVATR